MQVNKVARKGKDAGQAWKQQQFDSACLGLMLLVTSQHTAGLHSGRLGGDMAFKC